MNWSPFFSSCGVSIYVHIVESGEGISRVSGSLLMGAAYVHSGLFPCCRASFSVIRTRPSRGSVKTEQVTMGFSWRQRAISCGGTEVLEMIVVGGGAGWG